MTTTTLAAHSVTIVYRDSSFHAECQSVQHAGDWESKSFATAKSAALATRRHVNRRHA
jgi:hypothetical protein